ncbi:phosphatidylethanolamine-binding protein, putative [Plasmodium gallinaceum]|uniref:Phosphatidylethanolamine-binding protein, putative n=1 Tax=Plasmodium gallinaceum TaxID=5849 RepID=A0A1J1GRY4_PLAGA|nr:phosphatidylethanolamine-binding protein, putative [Plasmodium gallinaceum]CRG95267.1 phosphatidylethanolamine-binding protein, putative [Plasmodium gallinaceum]
MVSSYIIILFYFYSSKLILGKVDIIESEFGIEKCNSDKVKILEEKFYSKSCGGENLLPNFEWIDKNSTTKSYVITITSISNSNTVVHFIAWNIPAHVNSLNNFTNFNDINAIIGLNSYNKKNYEGPCYKHLNNETSECIKFTLYVLKNENIELSEDADYYELMAYIKKMSRTENIILDSLSLYSLSIPKKVLD